MVGGAERHASHFVEPGDEGRRKAVASEVGKRHPESPSLRRLSQPRSLFQGATTLLIFLPVRVIPDTSDQAEGPLPQKLGFSEQCEGLIACGGSKPRFEEAPPRNLVGIDWRPCRVRSQVPVDAGQCMNRHLPVCRRRKSF